MSMSVIAFLRASYARVRRLVLASMGPIFSFGRARGSTDESPFSSDPRSGSAASPPSFHTYSEAIPGRESRRRHEEAVLRARGARTAWAERPTFALDICGTWHAKYQQRPGRKVARAWTTVGRVPWARFPSTRVPPGQ